MEIVGRILIAHIKFGQLRFGSEPTSLKGFAGPMWSPGWCWWCGVEGEKYGDVGVLVVWGGVREMWGCEGCWWSGGSGREIWGNAGVIPS